MLGLAAEAGFWQLLSLPSLLLGVVGLIGFFGGLLAPDTVQQVQTSVLKAAVVDVAVLPMLVLGPSRIADVLPGHLRPTAHDVVALLYWPVVVVVCLVLLTTLYHLALPVRVSWRRALPGAVVALVIWLSGSLLLRLWLGWSFRREWTYGPLASPVAVLLFLYLLALAVLVGAELNAEIDRGWPLAQTQGARRADAQGAVRSSP